MQNAAALRQPTDLMFSGKRVHVWTGGTGPALLLLHSAWGDAAMSWSPVWNDLSRSFTIIAPDLPGFGASDTPDRHMLSATVGVLKEVLSTLGAGNAVVVGNSFGAAVAIEFASTFPELTQHLILVNGGYVPVLPGLMKKLISIPFVEKRFRVIMRNIAYSDKALAKAFPDPSGLPAAFFHRIQQNADKHSRIVFNTFMNQVKPQVPPTVPSTIIWGTGDKLVTLKQAAMIRTWLGSAKLIPIDRAGHMPQVDRPKEFVEVMNAVARR